MFPLDVGARMNKETKDKEPPPGPVAARLEGNMVSGKKMGTNLCSIPVLCSPQGTQRRILDGTNRCM